MSICDLNNFFRLAIARHDRGENGRREAKGGGELVCITLAKILDPH
jgi:hypothetical protein